MTLRQNLYRALEPRARTKPGLSLANRVICAAIVISALAAVAETEAAMQDVLAKPFLIIETGFAVLFLLEYLMRLWVAGEEPAYAGWRGRLRYALRPVMLMDLAALLPSLLPFVTTDALLLRVFRLFRILRLARLGRFSLAINLFAETAHERRQELLLSLALAMVVLLFSSSIMYLLENEAQPQAFGSIPRALWWSIATLTTVGYGDVYPITPLGRLVGGLTALLAVGLIALPTGVLAAAFSDAFQRRRRAEAARTERDSVTCADPE